MPWYKGNLHCHSTRSDGNLDPLPLAEYYLNSGYDFLGIADHNQITPLADWAEPAGILGIPCCEYTAPAYCHVVGVGVELPAAPDPDADWDSRICELRRSTRGSEPDPAIVAILQDGVDRILAAGGIPVLAHPFWYWTFDWRVAAAVTGWRHFEICNGGPDCNAYPIPGHDHGHEFWDGLLTRNLRVFGVGNDDAHSYYEEHHHHAPRGGLSWTMVKAAELSRESILSAYRQGRFYSSTGIEIAEMELSPERFRIRIKPFSTEITACEFFGGKEGNLLHSSIGNEAEYRFVGDEQYIRCRMRSTAGTWAWTQAVWLDQIDETAGWLND